MSRRAPYRIFARAAKTKAGVVGKLKIYDVISPYYGIRYKDVASKLEELDGAGAKDLHIHVHSPGGDADESLAIHDALVQWTSGKKTIHVEGVAASGASIIAMAGDSILFSPHASMMIHGAHGMAWGDLAAVLKFAERLKSVDSKMVDIYSRRTGKSASEISEMLAEETWMDAAEAQKNGFSHGLDEEDEDEDEEDGEERAEDDEDEEAQARSRFHKVAAELFVRPPRNLNALILRPRKSRRPKARSEERMEPDELKAKLEEAKNSLAEIMTKLGASTAVEAAAVVEGLKTRAAMVDSLREDVERLKADKAADLEIKRKSEIKALLDGAEKDGRLPPSKRAELEKPEVEAFAKDPESLKRFLDILPKQVRMDGAPGPRPIPDGSEVATLSPEDERLAASMRLDREQLAVLKAGGPDALRAMLEAKKQPA